MQTLFCDSVTQYILPFFSKKKKKKNKKPEEARVGKKGKEILKLN